MEGERVGSFKSTCAFLLCRKVSAWGFWFGRGIGRDGVGVLEVLIFVKMFQMKTFVQSVWNAAIAIFSYRYMKCAISLSSCDPNVAWIYTFWEEMSIDHRSSVVGYFFFLFLFFKFPKVFCFICCAFRLVRWCFSALGICFLSKLGENRSGCILCCHCGVAFM